MNSVKDIIDWKNDKKSKSIEQKYEKETKLLEWEKTDVLYSFLGIYVIGLKAFYPEKFNCSKRIIKVKDQNQRAYSNKYVSAHYIDFPLLNECTELKSYIEIYDKIGNVIPIWPGGNAHRGKSQCYDIAEIYFGKYNRMASALTEIYKNSFMDGIITKDINLDDILNLDEYGYIEFLKYICKTIKFRTEEINNVLKDDE